MLDTFNPYLLLILLTIVILITAAAIFRTTFKSKNIKFIIFSIITITLIVLSWILNFGWIRLLFAIPILIHLSIFLNSVHSSYKNMVNNRKNWTILILNIVTFYLSYILLPDGGDAPNSQKIIFGLVNNEKIVSIFGEFSIILILINFGLLIYNHNVRKKGL